MDNLPPLVKPKKFPIILMGINQAMPWVYLAWVMGLEVWTVLILKTHMPISQAVRVSLDLLGAALFLGLAGYLPILGQGLFLYIAYPALAWLGGEANTSLLALPLTLPAFIKNLFIQTLGSAPAETFQTFLVGAGLSFTLILSLGMIIDLACKRIKKKNTAYTLPSMEELGGNKFFERLGSISQNLLIPLAIVGWVLAPLYLVGNLPILTVIILSVLPVVLIQLAGYLLGIEPILPGLGLLVYIFHTQRLLESGLRSLGLENPALPLPWAVNITFLDHLYYAGLVVCVAAFLGLFCEKLAVFFRKRTRRQINPFKTEDSPKTDW